MIGRKKTAKETVAERRRELAQAEEAALEAGAHEARIPPLREELARLERRHAACLAFGDEHPTVPYTAFVKAVGMTLPMQPARTALSGKELAVGVAEQIGHVRADLAAAEAEVERLLVAA